MAQLSLIFILWFELSVGALRVCISVHWIEVDKFIDSIQRLFQTFIIDESNNSFKTWMVFDPTCCDLVGKRVNLQDPDLARFHRGLLRLKAVSKNPSPRRLEAAQEKLTFEEVDDSRKISPQSEVLQVEILESSQDVDVKNAFIIEDMGHFLLRYWPIFFSGVLNSNLPWVCTFFRSPNRTLDATHDDWQRQGRLSSRASPVFVQCRSDMSVQEGEDLVPH